MKNKHLSDLKKYTNSVKKLEKLVKKYNKKVTSLEKRIKKKRFYK